MMDNWHRAYTSEELKIYVSEKDRINELEEFEENVRNNIKNRFVSPNLLNYRPASKKQIKEWTSWLSSPSAEIALKKVNDEEENIKKRWGGVKWDVFNEEKKIESMFPFQQKSYKQYEGYKAYVLFGKEQYKLLSKYNKSLLDEDLTELHIHIQKHGKFIQQYIPPAPTKKKVETYTIIDEDDEEL